MRNYVPNAINRERCGAGGVDRKFSQKWMSARRQKQTLYNDFS